MALVLSDFNQAGLTVHALALIEIGVSGEFIYANDIPQNSDTGSLEDGELGLGTTLTIGGLRRPNELDFRLHRDRSSTTGFSDFFGDGGTNPNAVLYIQTDTPDTTRIELSKLNQGGGFSNWDVPSANESTVDSLATGDRILVAVAEPGGTVSPVALSGQNIAVEIDVSQGTLNVQGVAPVALSGQNIAVELDVSQGTLGVVGAGDVELSGQNIAVEIDLTQGILNAQSAGQVDLTGQPLSTEIDLSRGMLNVQSVGAVALTGQTITVGISLSQGRISDGSRDAATGLTTDMVDALFEAETGETFLVLLTLDHADFTDPIRVVHNTEDIDSRSNTYTRFAFRVKFPDNIEGRAPTAELVIDNVSLEIVREIRDISTAPTVLIEVIRAADPDTVELSLPEFWLRNVQWDVETIRGTLSLDNVVQEPFPALTFTPVYFPGLF